jgi:glycosyltransferase involved in cell wall biosynthesis
MNARPIHAVFVTPTARGGHPRYTWELMNGLRAAFPPSELELTLLTSVDLDPAFREAPYRIADVLPALRPLHTFHGRLEWAASRVLHFARREEAVLRWVRAQPRVHVLHFQERPFLPALHLARARRVARVVATVHNVRPHAYAVRAAGPLIDASMRLAWAQCATLFVHSPGLRTELLRELGPRTPPIVPIPHGVWTVPASAAPVAGRDGHLLLFGELRRNKGVHLMLDALRHIPGRRLVIAGACLDRALAEEVRRRVELERLPVELHDRFIPDAEVPALFRGAALVMLPYTDFHADSGVLHLAVSYGIPVVVTDVGALGEHVRRDRIGAVAGAIGAAELAAATRSALEPEAYQAARERCAQLARQRSWAEAARITMDAYRAICAPRDGHGALDRT